MNFELIGNRFSELRKKNGFTQSQVAKYLEVDQSYISKSESNERQFSVDILEKAAELFGCTLRYFLNDTSEFEPITVASRTEKVEVQDLRTIAAMNKIALNLRFMDDLVERNSI